jgi:hypothetical protein
MVSVLLGIYFPYSMNLPKLFLIAIFIQALTIPFIPAQAPSWAWAKKIPGFQIILTKADQQGNVYLAGSFYDTIVIGNTTYISNGHSDGILAKYDSSGNFLWCRQIGGALQEGFTGLAIDSQDNPWVCGNFTSKQIMLGNGLHYNQQQSNNTTIQGFDFFILKFSGSGTSLLSLTYGTAAEEYVAEISIDPFNNLTVCGGISAPITLGNTNLVPNISPSMIVPDFDGFVMNLNSSGTVQWAKVFGGVGSDSADHIVSDNSGSVFVSGVFGNTMVVGNAIVSTTLDLDIYLAKFDQYGNPGWLKSIHGDGFEHVKSLAVDINNNVILIGEGDYNITIGNVTYPVASTYPQPLYTRNFAVKFNSQGTVTWSAMFQTNGHTILNEVASAHSSDFYLTGFTYNDSLQMDSNVLLTDTTMVGAFVLKLDGAGNPAWIKHIKSHQNIASWAGRLALAATGDLYVYSAVNPSGSYDNDSISGTGWTLVLSKIHAQPPFVFTGLNKNIKAQTLSIYPNPASTAFEVWGVDNSDMKIYSITGMLLVQRTIHDNELATQDISFLPDGVYLVEISHQGNRTTQKLIKGQ